MTPRTVYEWDPVDKWVTASALEGDEYTGARIVARRIQRQRTKGWRMPDGAVYVGRPSLWGNPYSLDDVRAMYPEVPIAERREAAVRLYRRELEHWGLMSDFGWYVSDERWDAETAAAAATPARNMAEYAQYALRGKDLACWCPLDQPGHADVLLELANR